MWNTNLATFYIWLFAFSIFVLNSTTAFIFQIADVLTPEIAASNGYKCEIHYVTTEDGYILQLHRLPGGKTRPLNKTLPPVFLQHGLLESSASWVIPTPSQGLGYMLADQGYDVWLNNARGNDYSKSNVNLSPENPEFWMFSWHEMGIYDLPAVIDYILNVTNHKKLHYVGYSMGTTMFFVFASTKPEYSDKVLHMAAMAPIAYLKHTTNLLFQILAPFAKGIAYIFKLFDHGDFLSRESLISKALKYLCILKISEPLCEAIFFTFAGGYDLFAYNKTLTSAVFRNFPAGQSLKTLVHYAQQITSGGFQQYDYGIENINIYGSFTPPMYNISRISIPMTLFVGLNDDLADTRDVLAFYGQLTKQKNLVTVAPPTFNHADFNYGKSLPAVVNNQVISAMKRYERLN